MLQTIDRFSAALDRALLVFGCIFLAAMMVHITVDVVARALFGESAFATLEVVSYYYMVLAVFLPLSYVERRRQQIEVDLFVQFLPARVQFALYIVCCLISICFFGVLGYQTFLDAIHATANMQTVMANFLFYIWPSRWALPIGFAAACLSIINNMLTAIVRRQAL